MVLTKDKDLRTAGVSGSSQMTKRTEEKECLAVKIIYEGFKISGMNFKRILVAKLLTLVEAVCFIACIDYWVPWTILCFLIVSVHCSKTHAAVCSSPAEIPIAGRKWKKKRQKFHQARANAFLCICKTKALSLNFQHEVLRMKNDVLCIHKSAKMTAALVKFLLSGRKTCLNCLSILLGNEKQIPKWDFF